MRILPITSRTFTQIPESAYTLLGGETGCPAGTDEPLQTSEPAYPLTRDPGETFSRQNTGADTLCRPPRTRYRRAALLLHFFKHQLVTLKALFQNLCGFFGIEYGRIHAGLFPREPAAQRACCRRVQGLQTGLYGFPGELSWTHRRQNSYRTQEVASLLQPASAYRENKENAWLPMVAR